MNSYQIDSQLEPVLRVVEKNGAKIDVAYLGKLSKKVGFEIEKITKDIYKELGHEFNLNSPSQLAKVLYEKLDLKSDVVGIKYGKTHFSTSAQSLEKIKHKIPAVEKILRYRELAKLKNTYIDPLPKLVDKSGRLHTHYAVDTSTGRLSSKNPNLQNIPIRTELGKEIRKAFVVEKGNKLIKADYSQIELRIMAHLSSDKVMTEIFNKNGDIHDMTSKELGCDRRMAKVVNFGVMYGMSAYGLSETLKVSVEEAQMFIDKYFMTYQGVKKYIDEIIANAKKNGYAETMFGRRRDIAELNSPSDRVRNFGIRAAINTPIQGTAADIIKLAMIKLMTYGLKLKASMILQVHDELVFEVSEKDAKNASEKIKNAMEHVVKLKVPLIVDIKTGDNWNDVR